MGTWVTVPDDQIFNDTGKFRFTLSYPFGDPPDIAPGKTLSIPFTDTTLRLDEYLIDRAAKKLYLTVSSFKVPKYEANSVNQQQIDQLTNIASGSVNPYAPVYRTPGGYVKAPVNEYTTGYPALPDQPQAVPAIPIIAICVALIGVGAAIYFTLDKTEKLLESPTVNIGVLAIAAAVFFFIYWKLKGAASQ